MFSSFPFVSEHDKLLTSTLEDSGYQKFPCYTALNLDIQWKSFEEYSERIHGSNQGSGHSIRREIRKCEESGITIEVISEYKEVSEKLSSLYYNLFWKWNKQKSPCDVAFYRNSNEFASDNIRLFVARKGGEIIGFAFCLQQGETLDIHHCGFNYEVLGKRGYAYFNLCYYAPIKYSIEKGIKKIFYGGTLDATKKKRGCEPERMFSFVKCQNRLLRDYSTLTRRHPWLDLSARDILRNIPQLI